MNNEKFIEEISQYFGVYESDGDVELETWTDDGVNIHILLYDEDLSLFEQFKQYVNDFDVDEMIDLHREIDEYRNDFTIRESLEDFENFHKFLLLVLKELSESAKGEFSMCEEEANRRITLRENRNGNIIAVIVNDIEVGEIEVTDGHYDYTEYSSNNSVEIVSIDDLFKSLEK